jgi:hypothetical protein
MGPKLKFLPPFLEPHCQPAVIKHYLEKEQRRVRATAREKERATGLAFNIDQHHGGRPLKWLFLKICTADSSLCGIEVRPYSRESRVEREKELWWHALLLRLDGQIKSSNLI